MKTFEEVVLHLIEEANSLWVEIAPNEPEEFGKALFSNIAALHLLNRAMTLTNQKVKEIRQKYPKTQFAWNTLMMYTMSWELIPGVHGGMPSFTPLEAEESGNALKASLKRGSVTLFTGEKGQGKTLMARYITGKLFAPTIYVDCRQNFDSSALADLICKLTKSVIVLGNPSTETLKFVEDVVTGSPKSNILCVIAPTGDTVLDDFPIPMKEVRLENPTEFEIWRIRQRFAASFHSSYSDLPPCEANNRAAIVKSIQDYILQSMALLGKLQTVDRTEVFFPSTVRRPQASSAIRVKTAGKGLRSMKPRARG